MNSGLSTFSANWQDAHKAENADNPEFTSVFSAAASKSQEALSNVHAALRTQKIEADVEQNTSQELGVLLDDHVDHLGNHDPNTAAKIAAVVNPHVTNGLNGQVANKLIAQAVVRKAIDSEDITVLNLLNEVPSGSGTVGQIGFVKDMVAEARKHIATASMQGAHLGNLEKKAKRDETINRVRGQAYAKIAANPYADTKQEFAELNGIDPDEAAKVESFRTAYLGSLNAQNKPIESGPLKTDLLIRALHGDLTEDDVAQRVQHGEIDAETAKDLLTTHIPKGREGKSMTKDDVVVRYEKTINDAITKNNLSDDMAPGRVYRASVARGTFLEGMITYKKLNPNADSLMILRHAKDLSKEVLDLYSETSAEPLPNVDLNHLDPTKNALFIDHVSLNSAIQEYNDSRGKSGKIKAFANAYQMSPESLIGAQAPLLPPPTPKK